MRFRVQYFRPSDQLWHNIPKGGDSGFVTVGRAKFKARQAGRLFVFAPARRRQLPDARRVSRSSGACAARRSTARPG